MGWMKVFPFLFPSSLEIVVLHPELLSPEVDVSGAKRGIVCSALPLSAACPQDPTKAHNLWPDAERRKRWSGQRI